MFCKIENLKPLTLTMLWILCGLVHVFFYAVPFTIEVTQMLYGALLLVWSFSVQKRITDPKIRSLLLTIAGFLIFHQLLQAIRYALFPDLLPFQRYVWYATYLPMTIIPVLLLWVAYYLYQDGSRKQQIWTKAATIFAVLLILLFLSNDLHHLAFPAGKEELTGYGKNQHGVVYYLYFVWVILCFAFAVLILLKKCRLSGIHTRLWIPVLPCLLGGGVLLLSVLWKEVSIQSINLWNTGEVYAYITIGFLEGCIQIGLIQANTDYEKFFRITREPAVIYDREGRACFETRGREMLDCTKEKDLEWISAEIPGGRVEWAVDLSTIHALNDKISRTTEQIKSRNEYLRVHNAAKENQTAVETRNRLYDRIVQKIRPQSEAIQELVQSSQEKKLRENLPEIAVRLAYIKRRANIELLKETTDRISSKELFTAIYESIEYIRLCGIDMEILNQGQSELTIEETALIYEAFETIVEENSRTITSMVVYLQCGQEGNAVIRILLSAKDTLKKLDFIRERLSTHAILFSVTHQEMDYLIQIEAGKGGENR